MNTKFITVLILLIPLSVFAQNDSIPSKLEFAGDFRFRAEQDWNSRKSDGSYRQDRTRLRYRLRAGVTYTNRWYEIGFRLRTGNPAKQQDPQLTLGDAFKEFGTLPVGLEKAYFKGHRGQFRFWLGKNSFPFEKSNELFWSDNVFPEGVFVERKFLTGSGTIDEIKLKAGHFIMNASGAGLEQDSYFQGLQTHMSFLNRRLEFFPTLYVFNAVPNIPDGSSTFDLNYTLLHFGSRVSLNHASLKLEFDYYQNLESYDNVEFIPANLKDQKSGTVVGLVCGNLKEKNDWLFKATYAYLQRFAAIDYMAQNDWARWDYSSQDSPDGRLTNLEGIELVASTMVDERARLTVKYYWVEQLVAYGPALENGSRIRFDLDVKF